VFDGLVEALEDQRDFGVVLVALMFVEGLLLELQLFFGQMEGGLPVWHDEGPRQQSEPVVIEPVVTSNVVRRQLLQVKVQQFEKHYTPALQQGAHLHIEHEFFLVGWIAVGTGAQVKRVGQHGVQQSAFAGLAAFAQYHLPVRSLSPQLGLAPLFLLAKHALFTARPAVDLQELPRVCVDNGHTHERVHKVELDWHVVGLVHLDRKGQIFLEKVGWDTPLGGVVAEVLYAGHCFFVSQIQGICTFLPQQRYIVDC